MNNKNNLQNIERSHGAFRKNADPFFDIVRKGLNDEVDGEHFWDTITEDAVFEFLYHFPGFTTKIEGRQSYMDWFAGYSNELHSADNLRVYKDKDQGIVTLEYELNGSVPGTGKVYNNRFCSIITIRNRKVIHWRDYCDSLSAFNSMV